MNRAGGPKKPKTGGGPATLHDVATAAGVSIKTVSRVVNGEAHVAKTTFDRVQRSIRQLGYVPNDAAKRLASRRSNVLGIVFDNKSWNWINDFQRGALDAARVRGYEILMHPCVPGDKSDLDRIRRLLTRGSLDGVLLTPPCSDVRGLITRLAASGLPVVRISPSVRRGENASVSTSDFEGARAMTAHLLGLGHRRIAFVEGDASQRSSADRLSGFAAALRDGGQRVDRSLVIGGDFSFESGRHAGRRLLAAAAPPTAVFASNDDMAAGVLAAARESGIRVPEDLSIGGFDDVDLARQVYPPLTTVRQPTAEMAARAVDLLIDRIEEIATSPGETHLMLPTELIVRASTAPPPKTR